MNVDEQPANDSSILIVTGSSAGGIDALRTLVAGLPSDLNAAVVVAQHLDPTRKSLLDSILAQHSALKLQVVEGRMPLVDGTIYVIPPNGDVAIVDHAASLYLEPRVGAKPSIDRLFSTAATFYGDRLIAIVLSGMGSDGLAGARSVKEHGGTVIVQEPSSASYPSLPLLIPPNVVDFVARPEQIGALITTLLQRTESPQASEEQSVLRTLLTEMRERTGIDFLQYKMSTIMRRLSRLMVATGCDTLQDYLRYLRRNPDAYQKLVSAFLIKVTEFFRDPELFEELRSSVLPRLMEEANKDSGELRIWSAGASTGEEAYSIAMLCAELVTGDRPQVRIFATDLDEDAVAFARRGTYGREALREVPQALVQRYFVRFGDSYEVGNRIRNMTVFGQHDLAQRAPFPRIDLVLCRNVLIYFTKELQSRALQLFAFALRDKGCLVLGRAESTTPLAQYFGVANGTLKIYERVGERILIPPRRFKEPYVVDARAGAIPAAARPAEFRAGAPEIVGRFVFGSTLGVVVVDRRYDIITLNPAARAILQIHGVGVGDDLIHTAQGIDREALRMLIDGAFRGENPDAIDFEVGTDGAEGRTVKVICLRDSSPTSRADGVALVFLDVSEQAARYRGLERDGVDQIKRVDELDRRVGELSNRQRALLKANDDLTMANAELRTANEQLLINTEEAASAHEEAQTLNEEMQATNEELETLNEELQATVEELNTTNDELQARGIDLERASAAHEERLSRINVERDALAKLIEADGDLAVILEGDRALYISPALENDPLARSPERLLRSNSTATLADGRTLAVRTTRIQVDGKTLSVALLTPNS